MSRNDTAIILLLALLLIPLQTTAGQESQEVIADIWSDRGGEGQNATCGYAKIGENVTFYFKVKLPTYLRIVIIRPDGSEVEVMKNSQVSPEVTYKFHQVFIDPGTRFIKLVGGVSGRVLDYCVFHVVTSIVGGDVWTDAGGRGYGVEGGIFEVNSPIGVWVKLNSSSEIRLVLRDSKGRERVVFQGSLEGERSRRIVMEVSEAGNYTINLLQGNSILDYCQISVIKPVERFPPSIRVRSVIVNGSRVTVEGEAMPGTPGERIEVIWDWGDGSIEIKQFPGIHDYSESGVYTIKVIAKQSDGLSSNFTYTVVITLERMISELTTPSENTTAIKIIEENRSEETSPLPQREAPISQELLAFLLGVLVSAIIFLTVSKILRRGEHPGSSQASAQPS